MVLLRHTDRLTQYAQGHHPHRTTVVACDVSHLATLRARSMVGLSDAVVHRSRTNRPWFMEVWYSQTPTLACTHPGKDRLGVFAGGVHREPPVQGLSEQRRPRLIPVGDAACSRRPACGWARGPSRAQVRKAKAKDTIRSTLIVDLRHERLVDMNPNRIVA